MLGVNTYSPSYIAACRSRIEAGITAYKSLGNKSPDFEAAFFNDLVMLLDYFFVHRLRTVEGKDGNPLNEVRMLAASMLQNDNVLAAPADLGDKSMKLPPDKTVLGLTPGDNIALAEPDFQRLAAAFFAELERKFSQ